LREIIVAQKPFGQVWENSGKILRNPKKLSALTLMGDIYNHFMYFFSVNRENNF